MDWKVVAKRGLCAEGLEEDSEIPGRTRYKALGKDWYE